MKRDMDLVRRILIETEKAEGRFGIERLVDEKTPMNLVGYHVEMMKDCGLIDANVTHDWNHMAVAGTVDALTWDGCDFLDAIRNDGIYYKTKATVKETVGSTTMALFKEVAVAIGRQVILTGIGL